jgi:two-component SAPR family response regulator
MLFLSIVSSFGKTNRNDDGMMAGLHFNSFQVDKDSRTGLNLTPEKPLSLPKGFTLSFDFKIRPEKETFGYIFRITGDRKTNIDMISNILDNNLVLVAGNNTLLDFTQDEIWGEATSGRWMNATLALYAEKNALELTINGISKATVMDVSNLNKYDFYFGSNNNINFATTDVAPIVLKNIRIYDNRKRLIRRWKLARHDGNCVYDECESSKAVVTNPVWEINNHARWEKRASIAVSDKYPQITFDREDKRIFIVENKFLYVYSADDNIVDTLPFEKGLPVNTKINQLVYDHARRQALMYDFAKDNPVRFDAASRSWDNETDSLSLSYFMHHNKYFDERAQTLYTFGGYGYHQYSALLQSFSVTEGRWEHRDLSAVIPPRYLAAMGVLDDSLLLCFGGYGNISGKQSESPRNFYDLYTINPRSAQVRKVWELKSVNEHFTNSNSLVVNKRNQSFFTLSYPNNAFKTRIYLHEYSLNAPGFRQLADAIPFLFYDVESYCDLFMPSDSSVLFAVTSYMEENHNRIDIYSISCPPFSISDTLQDNHKKNALPHVIIYFLLSVAVTVSTFLIARRIRKTKQIRAALKTMEADSNPAVNADTEKPHTKLYPAINILDKLEILDAQGVDISNLFTPTLSQMFFLLYFKTVKDKKGITSGELQKILWPDKDIESARNSRNVYFNKLRTILNLIENITLTKMRDAWILSYDSNKIYCDYEQVMRNINVMKKQTEPDIELLNATLRIARKGKLLPSYENEWLDDYKDSYTNTVIEFFSGLITHPALKNNPAVLLSISETILLQDNTEECGIKLKCSVLSRLGKKKQALQCYNKYVEDYYSLLNAQPELTFEDMLK